MNRVTTVTDPDGGVTTYTYDAVGNRSSIIYPNKTTAEYTYDSQNRLIKLFNHKSNGDTISCYTYTLGPAGNRTRVVEHTGRIVDYSYDATYKLIQERIDDPDFGLRVITYTYDSVGNRLKKIDNSDTTTYTYDENDRLLTENSQLAIRNYTYDNNGNTMTKNSPIENINYAYDYQNRLIQVNDGIDLIEYTYDTDGMRLRKSVNGNVINFLLDKNRDYAQVLKERDKNGTVIVSYNYSDDLISQKRNSSLSYYHYDGQMSTRQLTDASQNITDGYTYDAFGILINKFGATVNDYIYTGEQYDPNVGFYYLRARYYNAIIGRFLTMDEFPGLMFEPTSLYKYLYCHSNPIDNLDPSGKLTIVETVAIVAGIGTLVAGCYAIVHHFISWAQTTIKWKGSFAIKYMGIRAGIALMSGSLKGEQRLENKVLRGEGKYTIYLFGIGFYVPTYTKSHYTFYTPGIYGPNPLTLTGHVGLGNISTFNPIWSLLGLTGHSPLEGEYIMGMFMGKGWSFSGGIYEGIDFGLDLMTGVSTMNYGRGPY